MNRILVMLTLIAMAALFGPNPIPSDTVVQMASLWRSANAAPDIGVNVSDTPDTYASGSQMAVQDGENNIYVVWIEQISVKPPLDIVYPLKHFGNTEKHNERTNDL